MRVIVATPLHPWTGQECYFVKRLEHRLHNLLLENILTGARDTFSEIEIERPAEYRWKAENGPND